MGERLKFFVDFDGTVCPQDVCLLMLEKFAQEGWRDLDRLWEEGKLSTVECAERTLELMDFTPEDLMDLIQGVDLDPFFVPFVRWALERNYQVIILSDGYQNYIAPLLGREGLDLPFLGNILVNDGKWRILTPYFNQECGSCGVCKRSLIENNRTATDICVYIGDGKSDYCAAAICDVVFAKDKLASYCRERGIAFIPFSSFSDVLKECTSRKESLPSSIRGQTGQKSV